MVVWAQGCGVRCAGCHNPHTWATERGSVRQVDELARSYTAHRGLRGLSLSGGEPFEQPRACAELAEAVRARGGDVVTWSGHTLEALREADDPDVLRLLQATDLLIDGPFLLDQVLDEAGTTAAADGLLRGSVNQRLHFLTTRIKLAELDGLPRSEWVGGEGGGSITGFDVRGLLAPLIASVGRNP